ncbi:MAG TPA: toprim domain-containing protein [Stellaceae bacterium]|nr:toprim domain-containing protein [Stellaceae bacterium]
MTGTGASPAELYERAAPLAGTLGQAYVERRGVPVTVADAAGVRFEADFAGRAAVIVAVRDRNDHLASVHGRYLEVARGQNKMLTVGPGNGMIGVLGGWKAEPLILVEGLFDALSLATCGSACLATIGRWAQWLPEVTAGRVVWLAFDASRSGEADVSRFTESLHDAELRRLPPPPLCKDWSTALVKRGRLAVTRWLRNSLTANPQARA